MGYSGWTLITAGEMTLDPMRSNHIRGRREWRGNQKDKEERNGCRKSETKEKSDARGDKMTDERMRWTSDRQGVWRKSEKESREVGGEEDKREMME